VAAFPKPPPMMLLSFFLRDALVEGCPLERTQLGPNTDGLEIADHGFPCVGGGHVTKILE